MLPDKGKLFVRQLLFRALLCKVWTVDQLICIGWQLTGNAESEALLQTY